MAGTDLTTVFRISLETKYINNDDGINIKNVRDNLKYLDISQKLLNGNGKDLANLQHYSRRRLINTTEVINLDSDLTNRWGDFLDFQDIKIGIIVNRQEEENRFLDVTIKGEQYYIGPRGWRIFYEPQAVGLIEDSSSEVGEGNLVASSDSDIEYDLILIGSGFNLISGALIWIGADDNIANVNGGPLPLEGETVFNWTNKISATPVYFNSSSLERPTYRVDDFGGEPSVQFDGIDNRLLATSGYSTSTKGTIFVVIKPETLADSVIFSIADNGVADEFLKFGITSGGLANIIQQNTAGTANNIVGDTVLAIDTNYILVFTSSGTVYRIRANGTEQVLTVNTGSNNGNWFGDVNNVDNNELGAVTTSAGDIEFFTGHIAEIIQYDELLSNTDIATNESTLAAKYGITLS